MDLGGGVGELLLAEVVDQGGVEVTGDHLGQGEQSPQEVDVRHDPRHR